MRLSSSCCPGPKKLNYLPEIIIYVTDGLLSETNLVNNIKNSNKLLLAMNAISKFSTDRKDLNREKKLITIFVKNVSSKKSSSSKTFISLTTMSPMMFCINITSVIIAKSNPSEVPNLAVKFVRIMISVNVNHIFQNNFLSLS